MPKSLQLNKVADIEVSLIKAIKEEGEDLEREVVVALAKLLHLGAARDFKESKIPFAQTVEILMRVVIMLTESKLTDNNNREFVREKIQDALEFLAEHAGVEVCTKKAHQQ